MFFWSRFPFVRVVLFFVLGILLGIFCTGFDSYAYFSLAVSVLSLIFLVLQKKRMLLRFNYLYGVNLSFIFLVSGYLLLNISVETSNENHLIHLGQGNHYTGRVISEPQLKGKYLRMKMEVSSVKDSVWHKASGKVLVYLKVPVAYSPQFGDELLVKGFPSKVSPPLNPEEFDYQQYLAYQNIYFQHFINDSNWYLKQVAAGFSLRRHAFEARSYLEEKLALFIPQKEELSIAKALILGKKDDLDKPTREIYAKAGAMHVLAVSGLHVGIIYLVLLSLLGQKQGRVTSPLLVAIIVIPTLWAYAFITGLSPSVLRAVTMFSLLALAQVINRRSSSINTLAISAFILLLVNPFYIMTVGFQLSYIAVAGIIFLYPIFEKWLNPENRILRFAWQITALSLAAQLATSPLSAYYFHRFPTYFIFSNLLVIPAATIIVWGGLVVLLLGSVSTTLGIFLGKILTVIIASLNQSLQWLTTLPLADINSLSFSILDTWLFYGLIAGAIFFIMTKARSFYWLTGGLLIVFGLSLIYADIQSNKLKQLVFYSVNHSWAIDFIERKSYDTKIDSALLADTGKIDYHLTPYRRKYGLSPVDSSIEQQVISGLGAVIVWHGKRILLANTCLAETVIPPYFDFILFKISQTPQNCYQEQILLRKFVNNQEPGYSKYNLRSQGALIVDI
jgi:competence protein ComEC